MDFQLQVARQKHPSLEGSEPLPSLGAATTNVIRSEVQQFYSLRDQGNLRECPLPAYDHPVELVQTKQADMANFRGKGTPYLSIG